MGPTPLRDLRHLAKQPLSHLGAAMVHVDRSILVDMHQGPRLIEMREREGNPELHRRQRQSAFQHRVGRVPIRHGLPPPFIRARLRQPVGHGVENEILDLHPVRRGLFLLAGNIPAGGASVSPARPCRG